MERSNKSVNYGQLAFFGAAAVVGLEELFHSFDLALYDKRIESLKVPYAVESALFALACNVNEYLLEPDPRADDKEPHETEEPIACCIDYYTPKVMKTEHRERIEGTDGVLSGEESLLGGKQGRYKITRTTTLHSH